MADDLKDLVDSVEGTEVEEPNTETDDEVDNTETDDEVDNTETDDEVDDTEPETEPEKKKEEKLPPKANKKFAEMRTANKQYERALEKLANQRGIPVEELVEELQNDEDKKSAQKNNITPEIQKRLRVLEEENSRMKEETTREQFRSGVAKLQSDYGLTKDDMYTFIDQAAQSNIDLMNSGMPMDSIYKALNHEAIVAKAVEKAQQEAIERDDQISKRSPSNTTTRSRAGNKSKITSTDQAMADLEDIFNS